MGVDEEPRRLGPAETLPPGSVTTGWKYIVTAAWSISSRIRLAPAMKLRLSGVVWMIVPSASESSSSITNSRATRNS